MSPSTKLDSRYNIWIMSTRSSAGRAVGLRERNLQAARDLVREAAHASFLREGYHGTTMSTLARQAGVARQTVYNLYESKAAILIDVIGHQVAFPAGRDQAADRSYVLSESNARTLLERFASAHRAVVERTAPILHVALQAAAVDEAVARHLRDLEATRVAAMNEVVDAVKATSSLRADLSLAELRRGFALLTCPAAAIAAIDGGMSMDEFERWVSRTAEGLLLTE